jgi:undecaprenyl-diphosphatase
MIEWLESIDQSIVISINSLHSPILDEIMWVISSKLAWLPFYYGMLYYAYKNLGPLYCLYFVILLLISVIAADLISSKVIKELVERYRPSHHTQLSKILHFYENKPGELYKGGQYGFVSSHSANFFAMAVFYGLGLKKYYPKILYILLTLACMVGFSRIYLGVHYLSDIIGGAVVGSTVAWVMWKFIWNKRLEHKV